MRTPKADAQEPAPTTQPPPEPAAGTTSYATALTKQARIDYEISSDGSSAAEEIKLSRAMTITALRARKYTEARAWQKTLSTALRIQAQAEGTESERSDFVGVLFRAGDDARVEGEDRPDKHSDPPSPSPSTPPSPTLESQPGHRNKRKETK